LKKAALILLVVVVLLGGGVWVGQKALDRKLAAALPEASLKTGLLMSASDLAASLLKGSGAVRDLAVAQPPGFPGDPLFTLAEGRASVRYLPLMKGRLTFDDVTVREATLTLVQTADGRLNVRRRSVKEPPPPAGRPPVTPAPEKPAAASKPLPEITVDRLQASLNLNYVNYEKTTEGRPYEARFRLELDGANLATFGDSIDEESWGPLTGKGYVESGGHRAPVSFKGRLAPLVKPGEPCFRLAGAIEQLDPEMVRPLLGKNSGLRGDPQQVDFILAVNQGRFEEPESKLILTLKNVKLGDAVMETATLNIPVHGMLDKPKLRLEQALFDFLAQALMAPPKGEKKKDGLDLGGIAKGRESLFKGKDKDKDTDKDKDRDKDKDAP
jgi:hypothetical protein